MLVQVLERAAELRSTLLQLADGQHLAKQWPDLLDQYITLAAKLHNFNSSIHPALSDITAIPVLKEEVDRVPLVLRTKVLPEVEDADRALLPRCESDAASAASLAELTTAVAAADAAAKASEQGLGALRQAHPLLAYSRIAESPQVAPSQGALFTALLLGYGLRPDGVTQDEQQRQALSRAQSISRAAAAAAANAAAIAAAAAAPLAGTKRPAPTMTSSASAARPKLAAKPAPVNVPTAAPVAASLVPGVGGPAAAMAMGAMNGAKAAAYAQPPRAAGVAMGTAGLNAAGSVGAPRVGAVPPLPGAGAPAMQAALPRTAGVLPPSANAAAAAAAVAAATSGVPKGGVRPAYAAPPMYGKPVAVQAPMAALGVGAPVPPAPAPVVRPGPPPGTLAPNMLHQLTKPPLQ